MNKAMHKLSIIYVNSDDIRPHVKGSTGLVDYRQNSFVNNTAPVDEKKIRIGTKFYLKYSPVKLMPEKRLKNGPSISKKVLKECPNEFKYHSKIGQGALGTVRKCINLHTFDQIISHEQIRMLYDMQSNSDQLNTETQPETQDETETDLELEEKIKKDVEHKIANGLHC
jgi:hypothetical protein